jgi:predicted nucleic-acid-binding protein
METEFIFADTNLFLRYLTNDVPKQADAFEQMLVQAANGKLSFITNNLVIAEIIWTLESFYKLEKIDIQKKILAILNTTGLIVDEPEITIQAILWYVEKNIDFADAYNASWMLHHDIKSICTFDRVHFEQIKELKTIVPGG